MQEQRCDGGGMSELGRIIWETSRRDEASISATGADIIAAAITAAGYRLAEPAWEPSLLNDGVYEYTQTSTCDGSTVYNYRRLPRLQYQGKHPSWESCEPEATA